jgi:ribosome biogenesis GTPase A
MPDGHVRVLFKALHGAVAPIHGHRRRARRGGRTFEEQKVVATSFVMPPKKKEEVEELPRFGRVSNNLKMGIVGLPNVGKSSLFNLLAESGHAEVICID